jgi:hypothetical protein
VLQSDDGRAPGPLAEGEGLDHHVDGRRVQWVLAASAASNTSAHTSYIATASPDRITSSEPVMVATVATTCPRAGSMTEVSTADSAAATVAGVRAAALLESGSELVVEGRVFVAGVNRPAGGLCDEGSVAVLVDGDAGSAYQRMDVAGLARGLM